MPAQTVHAFAEKVALITDGANPIGRAVALQLALQGCFVVVGFSGISEESRRALEELQSLGTLAHHFESDVSTVAGAQELVGAVEKLYGRLDLLVNTLKYRDDSTFEETSETVWTQTIDANLKATFFIAQAAVKLMRARPKPVIVNVVAGEKGVENLAFIAVQQAVVSLTESLAKQLAPQFRVNAVAVGERKKDKFENLDSELFRAAASGASEKSVASAVLFLLSSEAAGLNGQILTVE